MRTHFLYLSIVTALIAIIFWTERNHNIGSQSLSDSIITLNKAMNYHKVVAKQFEGIAQLKQLTIEDHKQQIVRAETNQQYWKKQYTALKKQGIKVIHDSVDRFISTCDSTISKDSTVSSLLTKQLNDSQEEVAALDSANVHLNKVIDLADIKDDVRVDQNKQAIKQGKKKGFKLGVILGVIGVFVMEIIVNSIK